MTDEALPEPPTIPVVDVATGRRCEIHIGTPAWKALKEWVILHGLDPMSILASTGVERDAYACCIRYTEFIRDDEGRRRLVRSPDGLTRAEREAFVDANGFEKRAAVEQGEAPPLPFPDIIERLLEAA